MSIDDLSDREFASLRDFWISDQGVHFMFVWEKHFRTKGILTFKFKDLEPYLIKGELFE